MTPNGAALRGGSTNSNGLLVTGIKDLMTLNTSTLEAVFNGMIAVHGPEGFQPTKRFESKAKGAERVLKLFDTIFKPNPAKPAKPAKTGKETPANARQGKGVYLPHKEFLKPPRPNTKREAVLSAIAQPNGATFETLHKMIGGRRRNVNIFLQDLNRKCGYGITTVREDGHNVYKLMDMEPDSNKRRKAAR